MTSQRNYGSLSAFSGKNRKLWRNQITSQRCNIEPIDSHFLDILKYWDKLLSWVLFAIHTGKGATGARNSKIYLVVKNGSRG